MIKNCEECNGPFEGQKNTHYCPECRLKLQREAHKRYYARHRKERIERQRVYNAAKKHSHHKNTRDISGWSIEFMRKGEVWTWSARKGNVVLDAGRDFTTLRIAQQDCLLALG